MEIKLGQRYADRGSRAIGRTVKVGGYDPLICRWLIVNERTLRQVTITPKRLLSRFKLLSEIGPLAPLPEPAIAA